MIGLLPCKDGTIPDHDCFCDHHTHNTLLGLCDVEGSRRLSDWLPQLSRPHADSPWVLQQRPRNSGAVVHSGETGAYVYIAIFLDSIGTAFNGANNVSENTINTSSNAFWFCAVFIGQLRALALCTAGNTTGVRYSIGGQPPIPSGCAGVHDS